MRKLFVYLAARGNPDYYQSPDIGVPSQWKPVASMCEASRAMQAFINEHDLGAGNLLYGEIGTGTVRDGKGKIVARVSYNGRVWGAGHGAPEITPKCSQKRRVR